MELTIGNRPRFLVYLTSIYDSTIGESMSSWVAKKVSAHFLNKAMRLFSSSESYCSSRRFGNPVVVLQSSFLYLDLISLPSWNNLSNDKSRQNFFISRCFKRKVSSTKRIWKSFRRNFNARFRVISLSSRKSSEIPNRIRNRHMTSCANFRHSQ